MKTLRDIGILLIMIAVQVFFLNEYLFNHYLNPYLYIYPLFSILISYPRFWQLVIAFALGASIDIMEESAGVHAAATVFLAFIMPELTRIFGTGREDNPDVPLFKTMSLERRLGLLFVGFFLHHLVLFGLESFQWDQFGILLQRSLYSSLFSFIFVLLYQLWNARR